MPLLWHTRRPVTTGPVNGLQESKQLLDLYGPGVRDKDDVLVADGKLVGYQVGVGTHSRSQSGKVRRAGSSARRRRHYSQPDRDRRPSRSRRSRRPTTETPAGPIPGIDRGSEASSGCNHPERLSPPGESGILAPKPEAFASSGTAWPLGKRGLLHPPIPLLRS